MTEFITTRRNGRIAVTKIQRPDKKNALTINMYAALTAAFHEAEEDANVRVHVLLGTDDCFTAGNDLGDFLNNPPKDESSPVMQFLMTISSLRKPLVAGVVGAAVGIGTTLLLHCDVVVAGTRTRFQMPFTKLGLCPEAGSSLLLPLSAGHRLASELLLAGDPFDSTMALRAGLVNDVVADEDVHGAAMEKAERIAALPPKSVQLTKKLLKQPHAAAVRQTIAMESTHFIASLTSPEAKEALSAFMEKRKPDFTDL